jgi:hypothetical protein
MLYPVQPALPGIVTLSATIKICAAPGVARYFIAVPGTARYFTVVLCCTRYSPLS